MKVSGKLKPLGRTRSCSSGQEAWAWDRPGTQSEVGGKGNRVSVLVAAGVGEVSAVGQALCRVRHKIAAPQNDGQMSQRRLRK